MNRRLATLLKLTLLTTLALGGCAAKREDLCPCPEGKTLDQQLMLVLGSARALHHQADLHLQQGEVESAIAAVRAILALQLDRRWPEAEEVRLDATARLAKLLVGQGSNGEQQALALVDQELGGPQRIPVAGGERPSRPLPDRGPQRIPVAGGDGRQGHPEHGERPRESFYLSNLHSVRGEILEVRAKRLDGAGQREAARQSAREAIAAFEASITINKRLQQQAQRGGER